MNPIDANDLLQLSIKLRLNARNGNIANESTPGFAVRPENSTETTPSASTRAAAMAYLSNSNATSKSAATTLPPSFAKLNIDVEELVPHLSNAKELYSAKSAIAKNAIQMYGTMVNAMDDDDEAWDLDETDMEGEDALVAEGAEAEAEFSGELESEAIETETSDAVESTSSGFEVSA